MAMVTEPNLKAVMGTFQTLFIPHKPNLVCFTHPFARAIHPLRVAFLISKISISPSYFTCAINEFAALKMTYMSLPTKGAQLHRQ